MNSIKIYTDLISVVIPTKNRANQLTTAILSARQQQGVNLEILVIDDASNDHTAQVVREIAKNDPRVHYFKNLHSLGGASARNIGIKNATGSLIAFLDDDDEWRSDKLMLQLSLLKRYPLAVAATCSFLANYENRSRYVPITSILDRQKLLQSNRLGGASFCLAWKWALDAIGGFDPSFPSSQDWELWLKLSKQGPILALSEALVIYNAHKGERITGNLINEYIGRRKVFLRFHKEMSPETKAHTLSILMFYRTVICKQSFVKRLKAVLILIIINRSIESVKFLYRLYKIFPNLK